MKKIKFLLLTLLFFNSLSFAQNTITWYRIMGESTLPGFDPTATTNIVKFGYYNINPSNTTDQDIWYPNANNWQVANWFGSGGGTTNVTYNIQVAAGACNAAILELSPELYGAVHSTLTFAQAGAPPIGNYPDIGVNSTDYVDWAAWQMAVKLASLTGGAVRAKGPQYWINKPILVEKFSQDIIIDGGFSDIRFVETPAPTGQPPKPYFGRKYLGAVNNNSADWNSPMANKLDPNNTSQVQADQMATASFTIKNFKFETRNLNIGQSQLNSNKGFDLGPSTNSYYFNIKTMGLRGNIHLKYATKTIIENCFCDNNERLNCWDINYGDWQGATAVNSSSNFTTIFSCRTSGSRRWSPNCVDPLTNNLNHNFVRIRGAYGTYIKDCVFEGTGAVNAIYFDYAGNIKARDLTMVNTHSEGACYDNNGATNVGVPFRHGGGNNINGALVNVSMYGGMVNIDKVYSQHPSYLVMVRPPDPPTPLNPNDLPGANQYPIISLSNIPFFYRSTQPPTYGNRLFMSLWPTSWIFNNNDGIPNGLFADNANDIQGWFWTGQLPGGINVQNAPQPCGGINCGPNRYYYTAIPR